MKNPRVNPDMVEVDLAINRVLAAERDARDAVARCRQQAERILADADTRAGEVATRAERRIRKAHEIADRGIERALAGLREPAPGGRDLEQELASSDMDAILEALARELIGAGG